MKIEDLTNVIEKQGVDLFKANPQQHIQLSASHIEELFEYFEANGYEGNEELMIAVIEDAARLVKKLRKYGVIV